jgi:hypothetical protein
MLGNSNGSGRSKAGRAYQISFFILLVSIAFFLSSCDGNSAPPEINYFQGIKGVEISFLDNSPPKEAYEDSTFPVNLRVENRGAFDIIEEYYGILSLSFDPFYVELFDVSSGGNIEAGKSSLILKGVQLYGKSKYHPSGRETFLSFPNFKAKPITGQREQPTTQISATLCYPYTTTLSQMICVDMNLYGENLRKQSCYQQDLALSDQGAPVAITQVEVENQPAGRDLIRPVFTIHVQNKGSGVVLTPYDNPADMERVCSFKDLYREDFNTIRVEAVLSHSTELVCSPNPIKLFDNQGVTRCQVSDENLILGYQNYQTPLTVTLSYVYLTSLSSKIDIKRLNIYGDIINPEDELLPYETQQGVIRCDYCAKHAGAGECQPQNSKSIYFQKGFSCQCSFETCSKLYPDGLCVPFPNFCPGATYCCMPACTSSQIRNPGDGKCYSKCSSSSSNCFETSKSCACGTGTDPNEYAIIESGKFCCPDAKQGFEKQEDCKQACTASSEPAESS